MTTHWEGVFASQSCIRQVLYLQGVTRLLITYGAQAESAPTKANNWQSQKLKQLTLVTLANENRVHVSYSYFQVIPYSKLLTELDVPNLTELGDLIIDALYKIL